MFLFHPPVTVSNSLHLDSWNDANLLGLGKSLGARAHPCASSVDSGVIVKYALKHICNIPGLAPLFSGLCPEYNTGKSIQNLQRQKEPAHRMWPKQERETKEKGGGTKESVKQYSTEKGYGIGKQIRRDYNMEGSIKWGKGIWAEWGKQDVSSEPSYF